MLLANKTDRRPGATAVEMAVVIAIVALFIFGILEYCLIVYVHQVTENAAREGARYAIVNSTDPNLVANTQNVVKSFLGGLDSKMKNYSCTVYLADNNGNNIGAATNAKFGEFVCVDVSVDYVPISPGLTFLSTFSIRHKCGMGSEAN